MVPDWIAFSRRLPTEGDGDAAGLVEVRAGNGRTTTMHWENAAKHHDWWRVVEWRPVK